MKWNEEIERNKVLKNLKTFSIKIVLERLSFEKKIQICNIGIS